MQQVVETFSQVEEWKASGGYLIIRTPNYEAPFWFSHPEVLRRLVFDYLSGSAVEREQKQSVRMLVLMLYVKLGRSAEEVSQEIETRGYLLSPNGVRQLAFKLSRRAEKICVELNLQLPTPEEKRSELRYDLHQFEGKIPTTDDRKALVEHVLTRGHVWRALEGDEEAAETIEYYNELTQKVLVKLGACLRSREFISPAFCLS
jgi:hypothetical protein